MKTEKYLIDCCLIDNKNIETIKNVPELFRYYKNVYDKMIECYDNSGKVTDIDLILGGVDYTKDNVNSLNFQIALAQFIDKRFVEKAVKAIKTINFNTIDDIYDSLTKITREIDYNYEKFRQEEKSFGENVKDEFVSIRERMDDKESGAMHLRNFPSIERIIGGIMSNDLIGIYGKEKSAKTTLALQMALELSLNQNYKGMIFSLEMSMQDLVQKTISIETNVNLLKLRDPTNLSEKEYYDSYEKMGKYLAKNLLFYDNIFTETEIRRKIEKEKPDYVIVDYLLLIESTLKRKNLREELNYLSRYFKLKVCKELNVPVVLVSQANESGQRAAEGKGLERDSNYFIYIQKGINKTIKYIDVSGIEQEKVLSDDEYLATMRGVRHSVSGRSAVLKFIDNKLVELSYDYGNEPPI